MGDLLAVGYSMKREKWDITVVVDKCGIFEKPSVLSKSPTG